MPSCGTECWNPGSRSSRNRSAGMRWRVRSATCSTRPPVHDETVRSPRTLRPPENPRHRGRSRRARGPPGPAGGQRLRRGPRRRRRLGPHGRQPRASRFDPARLGPPRRRRVSRPGTPAEDRGARHHPRTHCDRPQRCRHPEARRGDGCRPGAHQTRGHRGAARRGARGPGDEAGVNPVAPTRPTITYRDVTVDPRAASAVSLLVVDDDPVARAQLSALLRAAGYEVRLAEHGREAWDTLQVARIPVVICDWYMPEMDGPELCRRIRARRDQPYVYFILITSRGGREQYLAGMRAGADDFLTKPVDADQLGARLTVAERILGLRRELQQLEGLLPICAYCKRIRDDQENWSSLEGYIEQRSEAQFSHGICPECYAKHIQPQLDRP